MRLGRTRSADTVPNHTRTCNRAGFHQVCTHACISMVVPLRTSDDVELRDRTMSQLRLDPLTGRWVVISADRAERPFAFVPRSLPVEADPDRACPFCPGNEEATPPALEAYGPTGTWQVRVVPNLYPAFSGDAPMIVNHLGPVFTQAPGSGIHEILVFTPDHRGSFADLSDSQTALVMAALRDRMEEHSSHPGLRYSRASVNSGRWS